MKPKRVRIYLACSLDGFIAGPDHDLSWLPGSDDEETTVEQEDSPGSLGYEEFIGGIGALLMGRNTYDVVRGFDCDWAYGDRPVHVATRRSLDSAPPTTVRAVQGEIGELVAAAKSAAGDGDVYLDGGELIRQALDAGLVDEATIALAPVALGRGIPLFAGLERRHALEIVSHHGLAHGMVQLRLRPARAE